MPNEEFEQFEINNRLNNLVTAALAPSDGNLTAYDQLRPTERIFVDAYIATDDPRGAALTAFQKTPMPNLIRGTNGDVRAMEYLKRPLIQAAIAERLKEIAARLEISAEKTVQEIAKVAYANMGDYVTINDDGVPEVDFSNISYDQMAAVAEITSEEVVEGRGNDAKLIRKTKFKLHDKMNGLEKLVRIQGLNAPERLEVAGKNGGPIQVQAITVVMTPEQAAIEYAKSLEE